MKLAVIICEVFDGLMAFDAPDVDTGKLGLSEPEVFLTANRVVTKSV